ncbi:hypothetical protein [Rhodococcus sp. NPDC058521]|uniref:hypothetical protein n=1 Tax=Rhodococcus sp. NPDC058521 TaxID=3346536 RepID=UPI0036543528
MAPLKISARSPSVEAKRLGGAVAEPAHDDEKSRVQRDHASKLVEFVADLGDLARDDDEQSAGYQRGHGSGEGAAHHGIGAMPCGDGLCGPGESEGQHDQDEERFEERTDLDDVCEFGSDEQPQKSGSSAI